MTLTSAQSRAARGLIHNLSQEDIHRKTGISQSWLSNFENPKIIMTNPNLENLQKLRSFYEERGIEFIPNGVRERKALVKNYEGVDGFRAFMDDVYETAKEFGGNICLHNSRPNMWIKLLGEDWYAMHSKRMKSLEKSIRIRIIVQEGESDFILDFAEHRAFPKGNWQKNVFYAYGSKLGFLDFSNGNVQIFVLEHKAFVNEFIELFDIAWDTVAKETSTDHGGS